MSHRFSEKAQVIGVGRTEISRSSGRSTLELAVEAIRAASDDAGIEARDVDGMLTYHLGDSAPLQQVSDTLGIARPSWQSEVYGGGSHAASILGEAAALIERGAARFVLVYRALNGRSGQRMGNASLRVADEGEAAFYTPFGLRGPVVLFALWAARLLAEKLLTPEEMAGAVIDSRRKARVNPRAIVREELDLDAYRESPWVATPLRRADCCQETDAAIAMIVGPADWRPVRRPVRVVASVRAGGPGWTQFETAEDPTAMFGRYVAPRLWDVSGLRPSDVDVAQLYDAYSFLVPRQLRDFGLYRDADLADQLIAGGFGVNDALALNYHGGLLSEGYVHGLNNVAAAYEALRDGVAGSRDVALCTGFAGSSGSGLLLAGDD